MKGTNHEKQSFVFKDLATASHVFVRHDGPKTILQPPYDGPFPVLKRTDKTIRIQVRGKTMDVSIDRTKPTYFLAELVKITSDPTTQEPIKAKKTTENFQNTTRSGRHVRFPDYYKTTH